MTSFSHPTISVYTLPMLKVCLIQLPVPDVTGAIRNTNIPLASGYLSSYIQHTARLKDAEVKILPEELAEHGGDEAILSYLRENQFDCIGFSLYLWNVERSSYIASRIKAESPRTITCAGGPETADLGKDREALFQSFDFIAVGEGEIAFTELVKDILSGSSGRRIYHTKESTDLASIPNPYLSGILQIHRKRPVYLETMRGCPNRCSYCFYGKLYGCVRFFPDSVVEKTIRLAEKNGASEIYLMDPSFNVSPGLEDRLKRLAELNTSGIPIHTELRLESMTESRARLLKEAGFRSVEVGLQSIHKETLKRVNRSFGRKAFEKGAESLKDEGIEVRTGVILGLPGETADQFLSTVNFVKNLGIGKTMEIYPLSVLPGTECRERSGELGLSYMQNPPYWVIATNKKNGNGLPGMAEAELFAVIPMVEDILMVDYFSPILPSFGNDTCFISFADLRLKEEQDRLIEKPQKIANRLTLLTDTAFINSNEAVQLGAILRTYTPFTTICIVIESDTEPMLEDIDRLSSIFYKPDHYVNRTFYFKQDRQNIFSTRIFLLTRNRRIMKGYREKDAAYDLIVDYRPGMLDDMHEVFSSHPLVYVPSSVSTEEQAMLEMEYVDFQHLILYEN